MAEVPNIPMPPKATGGHLDLHPLHNLRFDAPAGLVVFLVAVPLCLGIALASGAPLFSGIIAGIVGGLVIPLVSRSALSVSGPAAGLTAIVLVGIEDLGGFEAFMMATFLAGLIQLGLGVLKAGGIGSLVPSSVIKGMLAAIGVIVILKQIPHAIGYDKEAFGSDAFAAADANTFSLFIESLFRLEWGALIVSVVSLAVLIGWGYTPLARLVWLPSALAVVVLGAALNMAFGQVAPTLRLESEHLVALPNLSGPLDFFRELSLPAFSALANAKVYTVAITVALVASIETLLCIEAADKLDPYRRKSPMSRELVAQGLGNTLCGLVGGLPVTSVIVRTSASVASGGRTKMAAIFHGLFLLLAVVFLGRYLNMIPLACLAAVLLQVGYKLAKPSIFKAVYDSGWDQFIPFIVTVIAIVLTDLLRGVIFGLAVGVVFVLRRKTHRAFTVAKDSREVRIKFNKDVSFIHRPALATVFEAIPDGASVVIDGSSSDFVDYDIKEMVQSFQASCLARGMKVEVHGITFGDASDDGEERPGVRPIVVDDGARGEDAEWLGNLSRETPAPRRS